MRNANVALKCLKCCVAWMLHKCHESHQLLTQLLHASCCSVSFVQNLMAAILWAVRYLQLHCLLVSVFCRSSLLGACWFYQSTVLWAWNHGDSWMIHNNFHIARGDYSVVICLHVYSIPKFNSEFLELCLWNISWLTLN